MKTRFSPKWFLVLSLAVVPWGSLLAQRERTYLIPVQLKGQWLRGSAGIAQLGNEGTIGIFGQSTEAGHKIESVTLGGPAATAGVLAGDIVVALDGASTKGAHGAEVLSTIAQKKAGEKIDLTINRNGEARTLTVVVDIAKHLAENQGTIGITGKSTQAGYKIEDVTSLGPAATAGVLAGDIVVALDGAPIKGPHPPDVINTIAQKKAGEKIDLTIDRKGETKTLTAVVDSLKHLLENDPTYQAESKQPPGVAQSIFGGSATIGAYLYQVAEDPEFARLIVSIYSKNAPAFAVDDGKFFILDGMRQQLKHLSLDEIKYAIQQSVAQNWKGGNYPPPPPPSPQQQYTLSGVERGNYTITNFGGGMTSITGTSTGTYTATPQENYSQLGNQLGYALGLAIQRHFDAKSNKKLEEEATKEIDGWDRRYFKSQAPVVAGENRHGEILYWIPDRKSQPPYRVVLFVTDPRTQKEEPVTFAFGTGAEKIRDEMASQSAATSTQPKATIALTNSDVVGMVKAGISPDIIVAKIKNTPCSFDTSPAALKDLKDSGLTDNVILAMVQASKN